MQIVEIRSYFWSVFSCSWTEFGDLLRKSPYSVRRQEKYGPEITPYLDTFYAVRAQEEFGWAYKNIFLIQMIFTGHFLNYVCC